MYPIVGGSFEGERLRGKVLPNGDDWTVKRADGVVELDLRVTLETDDAALIHLTFEGIRNDSAPGALYFRTLPRFETAAQKYAFLNRLLAVGGHLRHHHVFRHRMKTVPGDEGCTALFQRRSSLAGTVLAPIPEGVDQVLHCLARHVGISSGCSPHRDAFLGVGADRCGLIAMTFASTVTSA
jgi:hypothetical protein